MNQSIEYSPEEIAALIQAAGRIGIPADALMQSLPEYQRQGHSAASLMEVFQDTRTPPEDELEDDPLARYGIEPRLMRNLQNGMTEEEAIADLGNWILHGHPEATAKFFQEMTAALQTRDPIQQQGAVLAAERNFYKAIGVYPPDPEETGWIYHGRENDK